MVPPLAPSSSARRGLRAGLGAGGESSSVLEREVRFGARRRRSASADVGYAQVRGSSGVGELFRGRNPLQVASA
jgi:hypothetical protein